LENLPSKYLQEAVESFSQLPGIGKRTALRLVVNLLKKGKPNILAFSQALESLATNIKECSICHNISDYDICNICSDSKREQNSICVVEDIRDVLAIENTNQYKGLYHVLGGKISPMEGVGPSDLNIDSLVERAKNENVEEIFLALSSTMEGDTTNFYLYKKLAALDKKITTIAKGISVGDELEYTDEVTLGRSVALRIPYSFNSGN
jgi:recombination protein RecR